MTVEVWRNPLAAAVKALVTRAIVKKARGESVRKGIVERNAKRTINADSVMAKLEGPVS